MIRREYLLGLGVVSVTTLSGCGEIENDAEVEGTIVLDAEGSGSNEYEFDAESGNKLHGHIESEDNVETRVTVAGPENELRTIETTTEDGFSIDAQTTGTHVVTISQPNATGEVSVEVGVEKTDESDR